MRSLILAGCGSLLAVRCYAADPAKGDPAKGKETFAANCLVCHNADSATFKGGPGLKGLFKHAALTNLKKVTDANVIAVIENGGSSMPPFKAQLTKPERENLLAYLKTL